MPKNKEIVPEEAAQPTFTKEQILLSARYKHRRFFLAGALELGEQYTIDQIEKLLERKEV